MLSIRQRSLEDIAACVAVLCEVHAKVGYPVRGVDNAEQFLMGPCLTAWVAVEDGEIVGHACIAAADDSDAAVALWMELHPRGPPIAVLSRLFVKPQSQGAGTASALLKQVEACAVAQGLQLVVLALDLPQRSAIRFYERAGWERYGSTLSTNPKDGTTRPAQCLAGPAPITT